MRNWLESEFGDVRPASNGNELRVNCPFCVKGDKNKHMYVSVMKTVVHCVRCNWGGTHLQFISAVTGAESIVEAKLHLKKPRSSISDFTTIADKLSNKLKVREKENESNMPDWFTSFSSACKIDKLHVNILAYSLKRLSVGNIIRHNIGYCTDANNPAFMRMVIPVERGFYQARAIGNTKPKYLNPDTSPGDKMFNYSALDIYKSVFVCEGAISAIAIGENSVATLGNNGATNKQRERLVHSQVRCFTIAYDEGQEESERVLSLADFLARMGKKVVIRKYEDGDPDSSTLYSEEDYSLSYKFTALFNNMKRKSFVHSHLV